VSLSHEELSAVEKLRFLLSTRIGYELPNEFRTLMARQARKLSQELSMQSIGELADALKKESEGSQLWIRFVGRMTIGESYFFRNPNHMKTLHKVIFPELLARAQKQPVYIWSAGCARGEEPYTLAIMLRDLDPRAHELPIHIVATDIDAEAMEQAKRATYGEWAFRQTPYSIQRRYFTLENKHLTLHPAITEKVTFVYHHVAVDRDLPAFPPQGFDLILCRNLLMYLREDFRNRAGQVLSKRLAPHGFLIPGQVERIDGAASLVERLFVLGSTIYTRTKDRDWSTRFFEEALERLGAASNNPIFRATSAPGTPVPAPLLAKPPAQATKRLTRSRASDPLPTQTLKPAKVDPPKVERFTELNPRAKAQLDDPLSHLAVSSVYDGIRALLASGKKHEAEAACEELIVQEPLQPNHHCLLALVRLEREDPDGAIEVLRRAVYCDPDNLTAYYLWWLVGVRYWGIAWDRTQWAMRHLSRLVIGLDDHARVPLLSNVTAGDIRYLLHRNWDSFRK